MSTSIEWAKAERERRQERLKANGGASATRAAIDVSVIEVLDEVIDRAPTVDPIEFARAERDRLVKLRRETKHGAPRARILGSIEALESVIAVADVSQGSLTPLSPA